MQVSTKFIIYNRKLKYKQRITTILYTNLNINNSFWHKGLTCKWQKSN